MLRNIATDSARTNDLQNQLALIWIAADAVRADAAWKFSRQGECLSTSEHGMRRHVHALPEPVRAVGKPGGVTPTGTEYRGPRPDSRPSHVTSHRALRQPCSSTLARIRSAAASSTLLS